MISAGWKEITSEEVTPCLPFTCTEEAATEGASHQSDDIVFFSPNHLPNEGRLLSHVMTWFSREQCCCLSTSLFVSLFSKWNCFCLHGVILEAFCCGEWSSAHMYALKVELLPFWTTGGFCPQWANFFLWFFEVLQQIKISCTVSHPDWLCPDR